ncbi:MAG: D-alanyl-D-alanine carboxypeptidase [Oscillospiraceae bacterium]|nr:D-alanyl-D-alanine carboxypeptidase [Oscillospiraceae bacterium]
MKRYVASLFLLLFLTFLPSAAAQEKTAQILIESSTGQVLFAENENARLPVASLTKIMLLLIAAEKIEEGTLNLSDNVTVSPYASGVGGSTIWLEAGEVMSVSDLLKSVIISSANDASVAVAEHISSDEQSFVELMNQRARELALENTNFTGCVGFDDKNHYSSAKDISIITSKLFEHDVFDEFYRIRLSSVRTGTQRETQLLNTNKLADSYDGILGGKTGTTDAAGFCLSVAARRDGMSLIAVTLGARNDDERTQKCAALLDNGFENFERYTAIIETENLPFLNVPNGVPKKIGLKLNAPINFIIPKGTHDELEYSYNIPEQVNAPVEKAQKIGYVEVKAKDIPLFKSEIITAEAAEELTFTKSFSIIVKEFFVN